MSQSVCPHCGGPISFRDASFAPYLCSECRVWTMDHRLRLTRRTGVHSDAPSGLAPDPNQHVPDQLPTDFVKTQLARRSGIQPGGDEKSPSTEIGESIGHPA